MIFDAEHVGPCSLSNKKKLKNTQNWQEEQKEKEYKIEELIDVLQ